MIRVVTELRHDGQQLQQQLTAAEPQQHASCNKFLKYCNSLFSTLSVSKGGLYIIQNPNLHIVPVRLTQ